MQHLEAPGKAFREPAGDQERRRTEQQDLERAPGTGILVPEALDRLGPPGNLLNLVDDQDGAALPGVPRGEACSLPLLLDPVPAAQGGLIGARETRRKTGRLGHLLDQRRLADLPGAGDRLEEAARLGEAAAKRFGLGARVRDRRFTQCIEYFYSMH